MNLNTSTTILEKFLDSFYNGKTDYVLSDVIWAMQDLESEDVMDVDNTDFELYSDVGLALIELGCDW